MARLVMSILLPTLSLHVPDPAFILSEDGICLNTINSNDQLTYKTHTALAGKSLHDVLTQEFADWVLAEIRKTLMAGKSRSVEYQLNPIDVANLAVDQGSQWFLGRITPMPVQPGTPRSVFWINRNIQLQKTLQARLGLNVPLDPLTGALHRDACASGTLAERLNISDSDHLGLIVLHLANAQQVGKVYGEQTLELLLHQICRVIVLNITKDALPMRLAESTFGVLADFAPIGAHATAGELDRLIRSHSFGSDKGPELHPIIGISWANVKAGDDLVQSMAAQQPFADGPDTYSLTAN